MVEALPEDRLPELEVQRPELDPERDARLAEATAPGRVTAERGGAAAAPPRGRGTDRGRPGRAGRTGLERSLRELAG